ncbi:MAG: hypothetical protein QGI45_05330, partial [Myxococcota bacterium]|nr:hypothetical protein [Myxococcota bacterium]
KPDDKPEDEVDDKPDDKPEDDDNEESVSCDPLPLFFVKKVWEPFMSTTCYACHNEGGFAYPYLDPYSDQEIYTYNLAGPFEENWVENNLLLLQGVGGLNFKPFSEFNHGGGKILEEESLEGDALEDFVADLAEWSPGDEPCVEPSVLDDVVLAQAQETFRSAALTTLGRLPTEEEVSTLDDYGADVLPELLDGLFAEDAFAARVAEIYNDSLLTDKYLNWNPPAANENIASLNSSSAPLNDDSATNLLTRVAEANNTPAEDRRFLNAHFYKDEDTCFAAYRDDYPQEHKLEFCDNAKTHANNAIAREPLKIIEYVVQNDLPFSEILTADYTMVNPYSATAMEATLYGGEEFSDVRDPNEYRRAFLPEPHAGILTTTAYLRRRPTAGANRNRHRARMFYKDFLNVDMFDFREAPIDGELGSNPTYNNRICASCHRKHDPIAGVHKNWNYLAYFKYNAEYNWAASMGMVEPGFEGQVLPDEESERALAWLAETIQDDRRFGWAVVAKVLTGLTGEAPLEMPRDLGAPNYDDMFSAYQSQQDFIRTAVDAFFADDKNIKTVFREVILSPYFRARDLEVTQEGDANLHASLGLGHMLAPEHLDRKIRGTL